MAPGLRTNVQGRTRGANRGEQHDDFEGLPIRQWRKERHNIAPPLQEEQPKQNDKWDVELPHGMPRDSHLLPQHCQDLLRALRSGRFYKRPTPDDEETDQENVAKKPENKEEEEEANVRAFNAQIWRPIPRNSEGPEVSHLAKRRKGTVVLPSKAALLQSGLPTVTKAKVRRLDAAGNSYIQDVTLNDGQAVDGEIISTSVVTAPVAMNATSRDLSAQTTPAKRKPVAQRKKIKGPGRGRKKKLPLPASNRPEANNGGDGATAEGAASATESNGTKLESENLSTHDSPMVDDDGDDEGDDHEGGDDEHYQDHEMKDAPSATQSPTQQPSPVASTSPMPALPEFINASSLPGLAPIPPPRVEGSPLKNVVIASPTEPKPPGISPLASSLLSQPLKAPSPSAPPLGTASSDKKTSPSPAAPTKSPIPTIDANNASAQEEIGVKQSSPNAVGLDKPADTDPAPPEDHKVTPDLAPEQETVAKEEPTKPADPSLKSVEASPAAEDAKMEDAPGDNKPAPAREEPRQPSAEASAKGTPASDAKSTSELAAKTPALEPETNLEDAESSSEEAPPDPDSMDVDLPVKLEPTTEESEETNVEEAAPMTEDNVPTSAVTEGDDGDDILGKLMGSLNEPVGGGEVPANPTETEEVEKEPEEALQDKGPSPGELAKENSPVTASATAPVGTNDAVKVDDEKAEEKTTAKSEGKTQAKTEETTEQNTAEKDAEKAEEVPEKDV
ncbi:hypothetical protein MKZ38_003520 [Zalerion maritima]|uniref:Uncharacterized protein n=1 Tax=Zalerion maritima TaxID=339359 RepID=A0AAD5WXM2_9PEZI|nr:hypothetical protein MKZ38_003520 [Zalerion maritima]